MNLFKRIYLWLFLIIMVVPSFFMLFTIYTIKGFSNEYLSYLMDELATRNNFQIALNVIAVINVFAIILITYLQEKKLKKDKIVAFKNPDGEVTVSLTAIEDYIRKIARSAPEIKDLKTDIDITRNGIDIVADVSIAAEANIPELTEKIQMAVKNKVQAMLGVEEKINMKMNIKKIAKSDGRLDISGESAPPEIHIPYRG